MGVFIYETVIYGWAREETVILLIKQFLAFSTTLSWDRYTHTHRLHGGGLNVTKAINTVNLLTDFLQPNRL